MTAFLREIGEDRLHVVVVFEFINDVFDVGHLFIGEFDRLIRKALASE